MHPPPPGRLLLAFSGGPDSIGLAALLRRHAPLLAYVDHRLRGVAASRAERDRVRNAADRLGLDLVRARVAVGTPGEAAARRARYRTLHALAKRHGCGAVATAHTADDRAETVLLNLLRGTGLRGLAAPLPRVRIDGVLRFRPALDERRATLRAAGAGLLPARDLSNRSTRWARPRVRWLLLPALARRLGEDPVPLLCALADAAAALRGVLEARAGDRAADAGRRELLAEPEPVFAYLVEALRPAGAPLTAHAYRGLRDFLRAGRTGRSYRTPGGERWHLDGGDAVSVTPSASVRPSP